MTTRRGGLHVICSSYRALHLHGQHLPGKATAPSLEVHDSSQIMTTTDLSPMSLLRFDSRTDPHTALDLCNPMCNLSVQYPAPINMARCSYLLDMPHEIYHQICKEIFGGDESLQLPVNLGVRLASVNGTPLSARFASLRAVRQAFGAFYTCHK